jgi:hydrogenase maturation protease
VSEGQDGRSERPARWHGQPRATRLYPQPPADPTVVMTTTRTLVIGCGNLLRGDDAAGPDLVRRLRERGLPAGVRCVDAGTGGIDVALQMRNVPEVILVDACRSASEPGSLFEVPGAELDTLPPPAGLNLHAFRWDHAIAFARGLLGDEYPAQVTAYLVEGERFAAGQGLSPAVDTALDRLAEFLLSRFAGERNPDSATRPREPASRGP